MKSNSAYQTQRFRFLGTGAAIGVPAFYCDCPACNEARKHPRYARSCSSVLLQVSANGEQEPSEADAERTYPDMEITESPRLADRTASQPANRVLSTLLVDTAPDLREQLIAAEAKDIDAVIYTHEHQDHVGGLGALEFYVRIRRKQALPVYATPRVIGELSRRFDYMADCLDFRPLVAYQALDIYGVRVLPLPARHCADALGFLFTLPEGLKIAYFPDSARLAPEVEALIRGCHIAAFDATFNGVNISPQSHMSIAETIDYMLELDCQLGYLTHLSMSVSTPITAVQLEDLLTPYQGRIRQALDGLEIDFDNIQQNM